MGVAPRPPRPATIPSNTVLSGTVPSSTVPSNTAPAVAADAFRRLMSAFPTGVAVVTTRDENDRPRGLTCTSLSSVTLVPPTLLVSLHSASGTLRALCGRRGFAVNLLHDRGRRAAEVFSSPGLDRFAEVCWRPAGLARLPWLAHDAFALAECRLTGTVEVGDHTLVLGEVVHVTQTSDVPLLYGLRSFASWLTDSPPPRPDPAPAPDGEGTAVGASWENPASGGEEEGAAWTADRRTR
ncbi:flavin reductase family protein [Streptoalloteichus hindustanus]|uniref:NADH-FMN oxidoreductase RutF, flavin reductase (DIM6/NTAB) family n=1 Tax=Streptoalloteichus hindustanus TaxID=2017 RepID=A0A1M4Y869_STRHI|nr:flavin reductase family protein [Streptoalloteichus hindustanus]SHF01816.1 NADH-FMN oxidoreductase RutF, flavin reductase (DIM6/NTAB) family [Streptoalloteichus hindustanus]